MKVVPSGDSTSFGSKGSSLSRGSVWAEAFLVGEANDGDANAGGEGRMGRDPGGCRRFGGVSRTFLARGSTKVAPGRVSRVGGGFFFSSAPPAGGVAYLSAECDLEALLESENSR